MAGHCTKNECRGDDGLGCYNLFTEIGDMFEYELWGCTAHDVFASGLGTPSGIALGPDGRVYVGDYASGNITVFDKAGTKIGMFHTGSKGLAGLELKCTGNECTMWFTNVLRKEISWICIEEACPAQEVLAINTNTPDLASSGSLASAPCPDQEQ